MKNILLLFFFIVFLNENGYSKEVVKPTNKNNKQIVERIITLEVQIHELNKMIDSRSGLLHEKQGIFLEQEKRFSDIKNKCDEGIKKIDRKINDLDNRFNELYKVYNIANIFIALSILGLILSGVIYICKLLGKNLNKLEENYENKIQEVIIDSQRKINALVAETDTKIRKYQSTVDKEVSDETVPTETNTDNPF